MAYPEIKSYKGEVPNRGTNTPQEFANNADDAMAYQLTISPEMNEAVSFINSVGEIVSGSANFVGKWEDLTGAYTKGIGVLHSERMWLLTIDVVSIQSTEPSAGNTDWYLLPESGNQKNYDFNIAYDVSLSDIVPEGTNAIETVGGDFSESTLFPIVSNGGTEKVFSGEVTQLNLTVTPYTATIGGDDVFLLDINHYSKDRVNIRSFWAKTDGVSDDAISIGSALSAYSQVGGDFYFEKPDTEWLWDSPVSLSSTEKFKIKSAGVKIKIGSSFNLGGANQLTRFFTASGGDPVEFTDSNITSFYANFFRTVSQVAARKGDRFVVCNDDPGEKWNIGDSNCRPTSLSYVDYADSTNNILNFYPPVDWRPTISNSVTGEFDSTNIVCYLYNNDIELDIDGSIEFLGDLLGIGTDPSSGGQSAGGATALGMLLEKGKYNINCHFTHINSALRAIQSDFTHGAVRIHGSYNGNGIDIFDKSVARGSNALITGCRHAVSVGGSVSDGASYDAVNCIFGSARQSFNNNTYPGEEVRAFDTHQAAKSVNLANCTLYGGAVISNGDIRISGGSILGTQNQGFVRFKTDSANDQSIVMQGVRFIHPRKIPSFDFGSAEGVTAGSGTGSTDTYFFKDFENSPETIDIIGWTFDCIDCTFEMEDENSFDAPAVIRCQVGSKLWKRVNFTGCKFYLEGTSVREVDFSGRSSSNQDSIGNYTVNCEFYGCGASFDRDLTGLNSFKTIDFSNSVIENTDSNTGGFSGYGILIRGDESINGATEDIIVKNTKVRSYGISGGIFIAPVALNSVLVDNNKITFTRQSDTVTEGIRTGRNQSADSFLTHICTVRNNTIQRASQANSIGTGILITGLDSLGSLPTGFYLSQGNAIRTASTSLTATGQVITPV